MNNKRKVLIGATVFFMAAGYAINQWWPVMICCETNGTDCYPVDHAADCAPNRIVSECECPATQPDGSTDCNC